jgi:MoaA/NifB/PqqE/SkfB family radical SAM enzyme
MNAVIDRLRAPLFISWQLTRDCDLACLHCCTDSAPGRVLADELSRQQALDFADQIIAAGVPYVMLCGGEPLRVKHFLAVAERLGGAGVQLKIETNGQQLTAAVVRRLARLPIRSIQISLDGDSQEVYHSQRPGASLAKAHDACRRVAAAGLPLEITFAPTQHTIHEAALVIARARSFGAFRFNTGRLMRVGRAARLWSKIAPSPDQELWFRALLAREAALSGPLLQICHDPFTLEAGLQQSLTSPPATLLVLPNGGVKVAAAVRYLCGDIRRMTLGQAWENYRAAWSNDSMISAVRRAIADDASHADANSWTTLDPGGLQACVL